MFSPALPFALILGYGSAPALALAKAERVFWHSTINATTSTKIRLTYPAYQYALLSYVYRRISQEKG